MIVTKEDGETCPFFVEKEKRGMWKTRPKQTRCGKKQKMLHMKHCGK